MTEREKQLILKCIREFESNCSDDMRENWEDVLYDIEGAFINLYTKEKK